MKSLLVLSLVFFSSWLQASPLVQGKTFQDWGGNCEIVNDQKVCYLQQMLMENNKPLLISILGYSVDSNQLTLVFDLPKNFLPSTTLSLKVDKKKAIYFEGQCSQNKCTAGFALDKNMLKQLKRGKQATLSYQTKQKNTRKLPVSLMGVSAGLASIH
jgi:invasion protein IalB